MKAERISNGKNGPRKQRTIRRVATDIQKDFKCIFCQKVYGSEAAAIMHMRNKHNVGTKQDIERTTGISVRDGLLFADQNAKEWLQKQITPSLWSQNVYTSIMFCYLSVVATTC